MFELIVGETVVQILVQISLALLQVRRALLILAHGVEEAHDALGRVAFRKGVRLSSGRRPVSLDPSSDTPGFPNLLYNQSVGRNIRETQLSFLGELSSNG